jgi:hypothetical protein
MLIVRNITPNATIAATTTGSAAVGTGFCAVALVSAMKALRPMTPSPGIASIVAMRRETTLSRRTTRAESSISAASNASSGGDPAGITKTRRRLGRRVNGRSGTFPTAMLDLAH